MKKCILNNQYRCIYLTKNNYEEFLKEACPNYDQDYITVEVTDKAVEVHAYDMIHVSREFQYGWWVEESDTYGYPMWFSYSEDEFKRKFQTEESKCEDCAGCTSWKCDCVNERDYAVNEFANFLHEKAKKNNGLYLSSETRSWTHASIYDYVNEFREQMKTK